MVPWQGATLEGAHILVCVMGGHGELWMGLKRSHFGKTVLERLFSIKLSQTGIESIDIFIRGLHHWGPD